MGIKLVNKCLDEADFKLICIVTNSREKCSPDFRKFLDNLNKTFDSEILVYEWTPRLIDDIDFINIVRSSDIGLSGYFGHKIPMELISEFKHGIVNLHPSLLPIGRGSHPIVWSILENKKQGATIHLMDSSLDTGEILWQSEIQGSISDTSENIYVKATDILLENVSQIVQDWVDGKLELKSNSGESTVHKAVDLKEVQEKNLETIDSLENHIKWINAMKFANGGRAIVKNSKGEKWRVEIHMSQIEMESK